MGWHDDKYGRTELPTARETERLAISFDSSVDDQPNPRSPNTMPYLLYVPYTPDTDHEHIPLTPAAVRQLHLWLGKYMLASSTTPDGSELFARFFKTIEHGDAEYRQWLAKKFYEFWGVAVTPSAKFDGDFPQG